MASNPPASCCSIGFKHEGDPIGNSFNIDNIDAYISEPKGENFHQKIAILILPDVIGVWQNSKLIADNFAANGYTTLLIDLFNKDPVKLNPPSDFVFMDWLTKGSTGDNPHTAEFVDPIAEKGIAYLKKKGFTKIGGVGYCFGAKYVARYLASGKGLDVGYVAHPSFVEEEELAKIKGPFSISAAEIDTIFTTEKRHKSEEVLSKTGQNYQINLFSGVSHGFAVRGDMSQKLQKFTKENSFLQAVLWFDEYLL